MYKNLSAEMSRAELTTNDLAEFIGITRQAFYEKKKDKREWKISEMVKIQQCINSRLNTNYELDYLFERD